jgi:hypothetical protein
MKKFLLVFLALAVILVLNLQAGVLSQFSVEPGFLIAAVVALVIAAIVANESMGLILLVLGAAIAANVPTDVAASIGYNRDIMLAVLVALVLTPLVARHF